MWRWAGSLQASPDAAPGSIGEVCAIVDQVDGVHLQVLWTGSPRQPTSRRYSTASFKPYDEPPPSVTANQVAWWDPVLAALHATINGPDQDKEAAGQILEATLSERGQQQSWADLVQVLRRIQAGERDRDTLTAGLDEIDTTITGRALDLLAGVEVRIDPDSWQQLAGDAVKTADIDQLVWMLVAAASGDPEAREQMTPVLEHWAGDPETEALADVLGRVITGDRAVSVEGLTEGQAGLVEAVLTGLEQEPQPGQSEPVSQSVKESETSDEVGDHHDRG